MSNDKNTKATPPPSTDSAAPRRIRHVRLVTHGLIISSPKEAEDAVSARESDKAPKGYDIFYHPDRREFRFDRYEDGQLWKTKWLHETRIDGYEEWSDA